MAALRPSRVVTRNRKFSTDQIPLPPGRKLNSITRVTNDIPVGEDDVVHTDQRHTTISRFDLFSDIDPSTILISSVKNNGFAFSNETILFGPVFVSSDLVFMWDVPQYGVGATAEVINEIDTAHDSMVGSDESGEKRFIDPTSVFHGWTREMFLLLEACENVPELLVIGTGAKSYQLPNFIKEYIHSLGIQIEVMTTTNACSTYNVLVKEGRRVFAALIPNIPTSARTGEVL
ncbi:hypothetical protein HK096_000582, partial [Nowakowskiella sp. JEL0078]